MVSKTKLLIEVFLLGMLQIFRLFVIWKQRQTMFLQITKLEQLSEVLTLSCIRTTDNLSKLVLFNSSGIKLWEKEIGFEVAAEAENGEDALEKANLPWNKYEEYIDSERCYQITYSLEV